MQDAREFIIEMSDVVGEEQMSRFASALRCSIVLTLALSLSKTPILWPTCSGNDVVAEALAARYIRDHIVCWKERHTIVR